MILFNLIIMSNHFLNFCLPNPYVVPPQGRGFTPNYMLFVKVLNRKNSSLLTPIFQHSPGKGTFVEAAARIEIINATNSHKPPQ